MDGFENVCLYNFIFSMTTKQRLLRGVPIPAIIMRNRNDKHTIGLNLKAYLVASDN